MTNMANIWLIQPILLIWLKKGLKNPGLKTPGLKQPGLNWPGLKRPGLNWPGLKNPPTMPSMIC